MAAPGELFYKSADMWNIKNWNNNSKWSREAESFIEEIGYKKTVLVMYGSIETSVKPSIRMDNLAFNHHQLVAPMETTTEQKKWLQKASN